MAKIKIFNKKIIFIFFFFIDILNYNFNSKTKVNVDNESTNVKCTITDIIISQQFVPYTRIYIIYMDVSITK